MKEKIVFLIKKLFSILFYFVPVKKNRITLINFNGKGYGCNPKYIAEEIISESLDYELFWLVSDLTESFPTQIKKIKYGKIPSLYILATSKVIITNVKNDLFLVKKNNQYLIQTWHGSYSAKLLEKDATDKLSKIYLKESKHNSKISDLFLSNSRILSETYRRSFWCECEILECGFPRNDILFSNREEITCEVKKRLGFPKNAKLLLYAPTFRDDGSLSAYNLDCKEALKSLSHLDEDWFLLIRLHPNVSQVNGIFDFDQNIIDVTNYPDMQELLVASDLLITDYSSTIFEFAAMKKPSIIFASDIEEYQKMRGLNPDFFKMPYAICQTNEQLQESLSNYNPENGKKMAEKFMEYYGGVDNGSASKQVVSKIKKIIS